TTLADVDAGFLRNTATASGTAPDGTVVNDTDSFTVAVVQQPAIGLTKLASVPQFSTAGTLITFSYQVVNSGNVTLDPVTVTDPWPGLSAISCPFTSLAPTDTGTCTATYTTTQADVDNGSITNTGTAIGTPPTAPDVTSSSTVVIPATLSPGTSI